MLLWCCDVTCAGGEASQPVSQLRSYKAPDQLIPLLPDIATPTAYPQACWQRQDQPAVTAGLTAGLTALTAGLTAVTAGLTASTAGLTAGLTASTAGLAAVPAGLTAGRNDSTAGRTADSPSADPRANAR